MQVVPFNQSKPVIKTKELKEYTRTVARKGQVTIPVEIRRLLEVDPGDQVVFRISDRGAVELAPITTTLEDTFGAVQPVNHPEDFKALRDIAIEEHVDKVIQEINK